VQHEQFAKMSSMQFGITYEDGPLYVCPECSHEWSKEAIAESTEDKLVVRDGFGNVIQDGNSVAIIKDLKVKGASQALKVGTKVRNIRLVEGDHISTARSTALAQ
jgi:protein PhnA